MNTATLDKATDKIIDKMTPEELGKYCSEMHDRFVQTADAGGMTTEEFEKYIKHFYIMHIQRLSSGDFIKFLLSREDAVERSLMRMIAEKDLRIYELRMNILELSIETYVRTNKIMNYLLSRMYSPEDADKEIITLREETREGIKAMFDELEKLKSEYQQYVKHVIWSKIGGLPVDIERNSILDPRTVEMYAPNICEDDRFCNAL
jgi:hypothetical protein